MGTEGQTESWFPVRSGGKWGEETGVGAGWGGKVRKVGVGRQRAGPGASLEQSAEV